MKSCVPPSFDGAWIGNFPSCVCAHATKSSSILFRFILQLIICPLHLPPVAGSSIAATIAIKQITTNNSISVSPLIFPLAESEFMAAETVPYPPRQQAWFFTARLGLRWQAQRDTAFVCTRRVEIYKLIARPKAPSPLRSAGAVQKCFSYTFFVSATPSCNNFRASASDFASA